MPNYANKPLKSKFILPFATPAENRFKDFTKDMEMAAIVYLAESSREKGEGHILKGPDEKLVFITKTCYPIWLIPYNKATLVFDGLGLTSHSLSYDIIPDINVFNNDIQGNQQANEAYIAALVKNTDYFKNFDGEEEKTIEALIATPDLIKDFKTYLSQMKETQKPSTTSAFLTPTIDDCEIQTNIEQISNLRKRTDDDIENIDDSVKLLNTTTGERIKTIREEIRRIQEIHDRQIEKTKPKVTKEILRIRNTYYREITRASKKSKKSLQRLRKNQVKLQKDLRHLRTEVKRCKTKIRSSRRRKKKHIETRWTLKLKRIKKKIPTLNKEIKDTIKRMQKIEAAQKLEAAQQKAECDTRIEDASKTLQDLHASKEAEIAVKRQEMAMMENITAHITNQMLEMAKTKKAWLKEFDAITMLGRKQESTLVHVPFYLVRYERDDRRRYVVYPPSIVGDMGTLTKMAGALGAAKMKALLKSRSKAMTTFLNRLVALIEKNPMLEKKVTEAGIKSSVLSTRKLRMGVKKGLKMLENEDWMSEDELESFSELLYVYV